MSNSGSAAEGSVAISARIEKLAADGHRPGDVGVGRMSELLADFDHAVMQARRHVRPGPRPHRTTGRSGRLVAASWCMAPMIRGKAARSGPKVRDLRHLRL